VPLTCPACNKSNQDADNCQRCGCDLSSLHAVQEAAATCLGLARYSLTQQRWQEALEYAERSWVLCHSREAAQYAFYTAAALRDTPAALTWHRRAESLGSS
jgi:methionyl-tRNA synthetase